MISLLKVATSQLAEPHEAILEARSLSKEISNVKVALDIYAEHYKR